MNPALPKPPALPKDEQFIAVLRRRYSADPQAEVALDVYGLPELPEPRLHIVDRAYGAYVKVWIWYVLETDRERGAYVPGWMWVSAAEALREA